MVHHIFVMSVADSQKILNRFYQPISRTKDTFPTSCKISEFFEKSLLSGAKKHFDFQVTSWSSRRKALSFRHALCSRFLFSSMKTHVNNVYSRVNPLKRTLWSSFHPCPACADTLAIIACSDTGFRVVNLLAQCNKTYFGAENLHLRYG